MLDPAESMNALNLPQQHVAQIVYHRTLAILSALLSTDSIAFSLLRPLQLKPAFAAGLLKYLEAPEACLVCTC